MIKKEERLVITYKTTTMAMAAEKKLKEAGMPGRLIPLPKEISAGCGMAWCVELRDMEQVMEYINRYSIVYEDAIKVVI